MFLKFFLSISLLMGPVLAYAQNLMENTFPKLSRAEGEALKPHVGFNAGINSPQGSNATPEIGVNVGYQPYIPFGLEAEFSTSRYETQDDVEHQRVSLLARGTYNFGGDVPVLRSSYVGVGAGPIFFGGETQLGIAPAAGFDIPLNNQIHDAITLGLNAKYLLTTNSADSFIASAAVKYWF